MAVSTQPLQRPEEWTPTHPQVFRRLVDECIREKLLGLARHRPDDRLRPYHEALAEFVQRPGKRIRPLLFLQAAELFAPARAVRFSADLVSVAAGLEMLHAFVLIHDDLIDASDLRRALPALHRAFEEHTGARTGSNLAMVFGDLLFALAQKAIADTAIPNRAELLSNLLDYVFDTGFGEISDILLGEACIAGVRRAEIEGMYLCKTTRYTIECPMVLASVFAGSGEGERRQLAAVARPAGLAFQVQNDLKEFLRGLDGGGSDDLFDGKKTLLLRTAYERLPSAERKTVRALLALDRRGPAEIGALQELILQSNAVAEQEAFTAELFGEALLAAQSPTFSPEVQAGLVELLHTVRRLLQTS